MEHTEMSVSNALDNDDMFQFVDKTK